MPTARPLGALATLVLAGAAVVVLAAGEFAWNRTDAAEEVAVLAVLVGWALLTGAGLVAAFTTAVLVRRRRAGAVEVALLVAGAVLVVAAAVRFLPAGAGSGSA